jgi:hypothetical protein
MSFDSKESKTKLYSKIKELEFSTSTPYQNPKTRRILGSAIANKLGSD